MPTGQCPVDLSSDSDPLIIESPFLQIFGDSCPIDSNGNVPVCIYSCVTLKAVSCIESSVSIEIGSVSNIISAAISSLTLSFPDPVPGLQTKDLVCKDASDVDIIFGPFVSPTIQDGIPLFESLASGTTLCNGVACPSICNLGSQLGNIIAVSDEFVCNGKTISASN